MICLLRYEGIQVAAQHVHQAIMFFNLGKCDVVDVVCNVKLSARDYAILLIVMIIVMMGAAIPNLADKILSADCLPHVVRHELAHGQKRGNFQILIRSFEIPLPLPVGPHDGSTMAPMIVEFDRITGMSNIDINSFTSNKQSQT